MAVEGVEPSRISPTDFKSVAYCLFRHTAVRLYLLATTN